MKRFDAGLQSAKDIHRGGDGLNLGAEGMVLATPPIVIAMTDAVQPLMIRSSKARKPAHDPKQDLERYYMWLMVVICLTRRVTLLARSSRSKPDLSKRFGAYCWFVDVAFANGTWGIST